jgi:Fe(3+) dicitrate transport protein
MKKNICLICFFATVATVANSQKLDSIITLKEAHIRGYKTITGMGHLDEVHNTILYSGQKNEVLILDSIDANTAQDNPRQVLGRVPGSNYSETEGNGFPSNGIGFRGLNPTQSIETNNRQNGYNIAGDLYGYPESYYQTPLAATERIEIVRGASALQFGPQFGGVVNYITKSGTTEKPFEWNTEQTGGSTGMINLYNSVGGTVGKFNYFSFLEYNYNQGYRPNSQMQQFSGFAKIAYNPSSKMTISLEYTMLRNLLHMPGGLDDAAFSQNPNQSFRSRNWLTSPWNIITATCAYKMSPSTELNIQTAYNRSERTIVWRNEDGGPQTPDSISTTTNEYIPREVEHEYFSNSTTEIRLLSKYKIGDCKQIFAAGVRVFYGWMQRQSGGEGSTGNDANFTNYASGGSYEKDIQFTTTNIAPYVENTFHIGRKLSVTPGIRFEYINSTAIGNVLDSTGTYYIHVNANKPRYIPLVGITLQYKTGKNTNIYGNITQAYTPISYSFLYPMGLDVDAKIDANLKDVSGYNADLGWRGHLNDFLTFDASLFYMAHNNNIAIETINNGPQPGYFETNVGDAVHYGIESYVELNITKLLTDRSRWGYLSCFNSFAYDNATYVNGLYKGNQAEYAPPVIMRTGITYRLNRFSTTVLYSYTAKSYSDANNTIFSPSAEVGIIPEYQVMDWAMTYRVSRCQLKCGINNFTNTSYFTFRTLEYPGPGIIPSFGRTWYVGFAVKL